MKGGGGPRRGAIVGFGNVAEHAHLPAWGACDAFEIVAVVEPSPRRAARARHVLPAAEVHADLTALLERTEIDFIDICTPPCNHASLVRDACRAGIDVLCEKPLVATLAELELVEAVATETGRVVFTVDNWKYAPIWESVAALLRDDAIGRTETLSLSVLRPPNSGGGNTDWRREPAISGGGILLDHGWHHLYLVMSLLGARPIAVSAQMDYVDGDAGRYETTVDLALRFAQASARVHLTWRADRRENFGTISGSEGSIAINDDHVVVSRTGAAPRRLAFGEALSAGSHHPDWMRPVIDAFERELTVEHERGLNLAQAGLCVRIIDHAYRSSIEGAPVPLLAA